MSKPYVAKKRSISEDLSGSPLLGPTPSLDETDTRKMDHKRLIRLENRVDHSIALLEQLSRQMIEVMGMVRNGSTHPGARLRSNRKPSISGSFNNLDITPRTHTRSAVVIQKLWRGFSARRMSDTGSRSRMSSMSDDLTFPMPSRSMTRTASGRLAWDGENGSPSKTNGENRSTRRFSSNPNDDDEDDAVKDEEQQKLKDVELIELARTAPKTNKIFPEGFQQAVPSSTSIISKMPFRGMFKKKASEREVITNSDGSYEVIENRKVFHYVIQEDPSFMISPKGRFRLTWDFCVVTPLLLYLAVMMPFRLCFANEPRTFSGAYWFEFMIDIIFIIDIMFNFRTGFFVNPLEPNMIEYDPVRVRYNYGTTWFPLDLASGIPFSLIELLFATGPTSGVKTLKTVRLIRFIKLGRLFKIEKILTNMDRDTLDRIEDFFQNNSTRSVLVVCGLALKTGYVCHLLSCLWVFIGRLGSMRDKDNWLAHDMKGPFDYHDTYNESRYVGEIYLAAFYFCFTTMSSVGYGDIVAKNNMERIFAVLLEFTGSLVFATIIAALTSVVTSMDMNQRKIAEQLDSVASFVVNRNFPDGLGRRIRRHFRHFYSLKSAIDESKIFGELSTSLRKEVSAYLVSELMGDVSLFTSMSPLLWPHLLPILRPMRFEAEEIVCRQDEQCREMYVVLSGQLVGTTILVGAESKIRRITSGDTINVLTVLGIWSRCVETVVADVPVETYAISEKDFQGLFISEADLQTFADMKEREVYNFKMDTSIKCEADAALEYGKPLYMCVFSRLDLIIIGASGLAPTGLDGLSDTYAVVEVINLKTGKLISKSFTFRTATVDNTNNPIWMEGFQWMDIPGAFDKLALRISIYDSDFVGLDTFLGYIQIPFTQLLKECTLSLINKGHMNPQPNHPPPSVSKLGTGSSVLSTVPSLNLKDDDDRSVDSFSDKNEPPAPSMALSPVGPPPSLQEKNTGLGGLQFRRVQRTNSNSSTGSSSNLASTVAPSSLSSLFAGMTTDKKNGHKRSHSLSELPKLQPGHVQKWYDLGARKNMNTTDGMYKSWNGKIYPSKKMLAQQRRHPEFQGKQSLSVANVTGSIQIRYHVRRAERDTIEQPTANIVSTTKNYASNGGSSSGGGGGGVNAVPFGLKKKSSFKIDTSS